MQIEAVSRSRPKLDTRAYRGARGFRLGFSLSVICAFLGAASAPAADEKAAAPSSDAVTFTKDVAPILFDHCAICHRPEQSGPFSLLSYRDAKKHAKEIAEVTHRRYMPPWLAEPGYGEFANDRRLSTEQIETLQRWYAAGAPEGNPADLRPAPTYSAGWQLGQPDLIVKLPQSYTLRAEGKDVYRNFVVPIPVTGTHYVKGVEFLPDNWRVIHHAFFNVDRTRQSRRQAEKENPPGFDGMRLPDNARMPGGQFLSWQPGRLASMGSEGLPWVLEKDTDLVMQLHMHPSGKPETIQPSLGFYFTDRPPTNSPFRVNLSSFIIDIPAGAKDYVIEDKYVLPVDTDLLRIMPHTHYLGKELQGYAILPDGTKKWLLMIKDWDFNWQGDYRFAEPIFLPKGTTLCMHFSYDNSDENVHNPSHPPKRVKYGLETTDEMCELWFQVMPRDVKDLSVLGRDFYGKLARVIVDYNEYLVRVNPRDAVAQTKLGRALMALGRIPEAFEHLTTAVQIDPDNDKAHYELGFMYMRQGRTAEAKMEFLAVVRVNPADYEAQGSLGGIYLREGNAAAAAEQFQKALQLNPDDVIARRGLENARRALSAPAPRGN